MKNVYELEVEQADGTFVTYVVINTDNAATSMTKAEYDRRQAEHLTEIPTQEAQSL